MTLTTHAAVGMLVAQVTGSPSTGFLAGAVSHYFMDAIPHGDEFLYWRHKHNARDPLPFLVSTIDVLFLVLLVLFVINFRNDPQMPITIFGAIGGVVPDILMMFGRAGKEVEHVPQKISRIPLYFITRLIQIHYDFHKLFHDTIKTPIRFRTGLFMQSVFLLVFVRYFIV